LTCVQSEVLQTVVDEFANLSSETTNVFIFNANGETMASDRVTTEDQTKAVFASFADLSHQLDIIGGVESLSIQGATSQIHIATVENLYLAMISSREADAKIIDSLAHVLVPTIVKLLNQQPTKEEMEIPQELEITEEEPIEESVLPEIEPDEESALPEVETVEESVLPEEEPAEEEQEMNNNFEEKSSSESLFPEPPVNQLMVEKIKGILVHADTVRVDSEVISKWNELYGKKDLLVNIQTLEGKETTCKFKPLKDARSNAKGIIQIPEKILQILQVTKGQLVIVSPTMETLGD